MNKHHFLYLTADRIGEPSGGGLVTAQEYKALSEFAESEGTVAGGTGREELTTNPDDHITTVIGEPWVWDHLAYHKFGSDVKLCHIYSGCFPECVRKLKGQGAKVVYTVAAHSVETSRKAHADLGLSYPYNHLTDPLQWRRYSAGYWMADAIVVPSTYSERVVQEQHLALFGKPHPRVVVIPHGCHVPEKVAPLPGSFVVGYLGSFGADKGVRHLLEAWKKLSYKDAVLLLGGRDSTSEWAQRLVAKYGGGSIELMGWVKDVRDFYDRISLYVQPSVTEGFGIEVLEAMAHGRPVLCSEGAGAVDVMFGRSFPCENVDGLAACIDSYKKDHELLIENGWQARKRSQEYDWKLIRQRYQALYADLLKG